MVIVVKVPISSKSVMGRINSFIKKLGPGLLFAGTAIGVSHLVQSTKAGAEFGFGLTWALLIAILLKYPFFKFAPKNFKIKLVSLCFGKVLKIKVTKGELIISNGLEMADDYLPGGMGATPPLPLLGLNKHINKK